jgi:hypothetical protein
MPWLIWEFTDSRDRGVVEVWLNEERIQKKARTILNVRIDLLRRLGSDAPGLLVGPIYRHVYKLRIRSEGVQLRPMLCKGPISNDLEYTLLLGATERGDHYQPRNAPELAEENREVVLMDRSRRRLHERFPK